MSKNQLIGVCLLPIALWLLAVDASAQARACSVAGQSGMSRVTVGPTALYLSADGALFKCTSGWQVESSSGCFVCSAGFSVVQEDTTEQVRGIVSMITALKAVQEATSKKLEAVEACDKKMARVESTVVEKIAKFSADQITTEDLKARLEKLKEEILEEVRQAPPTPAPASTPPKD